MGSVGIEQPLAHLGESLQGLPCLGFWVSGKAAGLLDAGLKACDFAEGNGGDGAGGGENEGEVVGSVCAADGFP